MKILQYVSCLSCLIYSHSTKKHDRIAEGTEVDDPTQFPFFAQLAIPQYPVVALVDRCGGALVSRRWVLTAGHCFPWETEKIHWLMHLRVNIVFMGSIQGIEIGKYPGVSKRISAIKHHPDYLCEERIVDHRLVELFWNDIALVKVKTPFKLSRTIRTIRLSHNFGRDSWGILIGSGLTVINRPDSISEKVNYAVLPVKKYDELTVPLNHETNTSFYLEGIIGDDDENSTGYGHFGDSGGPFINNISEGNIPTLLGILSVTDYNIFKGRVSHAVERVDLAIPFIMDYVKHGARSRPEKVTRHPLKASHVRAVLHIGLFRFLGLFILYVMLF